MKNPQFTFTAGELSPSLWARADLERYATALKTCRNFIVRPQGGVDNRSGTRYVSSVRNMARPARFVPFIYSINASYVVVFNDDKIRFVRNGALIESSPGVPYELDSPYGDFELPLLHYTQSADVLTITVPTRPVYDLKRYGETNWQLVLFDAVDGPFRDINVDESKKLAASAATGNITITSSGSLFTQYMVGSLVYFEPQELRGTKPWEPAERNVAVGQLRRSDFKVYKCASVPSLTGLAGTPYYVTGATRPTHDAGRAFDGPQDSRSDGTNGYKVGVEWEYVHGGYGIARITGFTNATTVTATVIKRLPDECVGGLGSPANTWTFSGNGSTTQFTITGATSNSVYDYEVTIDGVVVPNEPPAGGGGGGGGGGDDGGDWPPGAEQP